MKSCAAALRRLPMLEELETRQLLSGTGPFAISALAHPLAAPSLGPAVVQGPATNPGQSVTAGNQGPTAPTNPTQVSRPTPKPSPNPASSPANQIPFAGLQTLPPGSQGNTSILFGTPITPPAATGSPTPPAATFAQTQFALGNALSVVGGAGQTAVLAYNLVPPGNQYVVPPDILILGGGGGPQEFPVQPQTPKGEAEPQELEAEPEEPPTVPTPPTDVQPPLIIPPLVDRMGMSDESRVELAGKPTPEMDRFFASLPQEIRNLVPWLDEVALSPGTFNLVLTSVLIELARTEIPLAA